MVSLLEYSSISPNVSVIIDIMGRPWGWLVIFLSLRFLLFSLFSLNKFFFFTVNRRNETGVNTTLL